jgi:hypothetical protein
MSCHPPARQVGPYRPEDGLTTGERGRSPSADLHMKPYAKRHVKVYADTGILLNVPSTEAQLRKAWETWSVDRRHAVVAAVLPAVVVGPAKIGKRFDPDRVIPVWRV